MKRLLIALAALFMLPLPSQAATQLFTTDFSGASMGTCNIGSGQNSGSWPINGAGFPMNPFGGSATGVQIIANSTIACNNSTTPPEVDLGGAKFFVPEIVVGARHDGTTGPMLHQIRFLNFDGLMQFPYVTNPSSDVLDGYVLAWIKFPSNFIGTNNWRALFEWKDACENASCPANGYRIAVYVQSDANGNIFWDMHGDNNPPGPWFWDHTSNVTIPVNQWIKVEWAWHRTHDNTSWAKFWMNGSLIMDQEGQGGCSGCSAVDGFYVTADDTAAINRIMIGQMYGPSPTPQEQWIDHIEVWNGVPTSNPAPVVSSISPTSGFTTGGTVVTVTGSGFSASTPTVKFGTVPATAVTVASDTSLTATSPSEGAGTVDITVATSNGTSSTGSGDRFTYSVPPPSVTSSTYNIVTGGSFTASFTGITAGCNNGATTDWIGFYPAGAPLSMQVANVAPPCGSTSGSFPMSAVTNTGAPVPAGNYNLRYYGGVGCCPLLAQSNTIVVTVPLPATPVGVAASCPSSPAISWTAVTGAISYNVYRNGTKIGSPTSNAFTDSSPPSSTIEAYTVSAVNSAGESPQSSPVTVRTCGP